MKVGVFRTPKMKIQNSQISKMKVRRFTELSGHLKKRLSYSSTICRSEPNGPRFVNSSLQSIFLSMKNRELPQEQILWGHQEDFKKD